MAAPHVAGVAAQVLGADPTLSVAQAKQVMIAAAEEDYISLSANAIAAGTPNRFLIGGAGIVSLLKPPPPSQPSRPSPPLPPPKATFDFDFNNGIDASPGWSTGGGDPPTLAFTKRDGIASSWHRRL